MYNISAGNFILSFRLSISMLIRIIIQTIHYYRQSVQTLFKHLILLCKLKYFTADICNIEDTCNQNMLHSRNIELSCYFCLIILQLSLEITHMQKKIIVM